jgi:hypothetical protein
MSTQSDSQKPSQAEANVNAKATAEAQAATEAKAAADSQCTQPVTNLILKNLPNLIVLKRTKNLNHQDKPYPNFLSPSKPEPSHKV